MHRVAVILNPQVASFLPGKECRPNVFAAASLPLEIRAGAGGVDRIFLSVQVDFIYISPEDQRLKLLLAPIEDLNSPFPVIGVPAVLNPAANITG
jgi:hypothetical protein